MRIACNITGKKHRSLKNANRCVLFLLEAVIWFGASTDDTKYNKAVCLNFSAFEYRGGGFVPRNGVYKHTFISRPTKQTRARQSQMVCGRRRRCSLSW